MSYTYPASLLCDIYKLNHREQYPEGTELIYSTWTPRKSRIKGIDKVVNFGVQGFIKKFLIDYFNENFFKRPKVDVLNEYKRFIKFSLGVENPDASHIEELHNLGYLPIKIRSLKEGTLVPIRVPMLTIENTDPDFFWLTNYLETIISNEIWQPITSATLSFEYRKILEKYAMDTVGDTSDVLFQLHDFSMRGMSSLESSKTSGAAHLLSFVGTDSVPAIMYHEEFYNANIEKELIGTSIPATEHSVMCANADENLDEFENFKRLITEVYPKGFVSIVSDTYDFWNIIGDVIPRLKNEILNRDGRVVIRPDSGDPVEIICGKFIPEFESIDEAEEILLDDMIDEARNDCEGSHNVGNDTYERLCQVEGIYYKVTGHFEYNRYDKTYYYVDGRKVTSKEFTPELSDLGLIEALWNIFGGIITDKGFKKLNGHIGAIYGDSITIERASEICRRLKGKGFASTNIVLGVGSYTYQYNTRDTFGFAMKATYAIVNGKAKLIYKDPKTDDGTKRSQRGIVAVVDIDNKLEVVDGLDAKTYRSNFLNLDKMEDVFFDGKLIRDESLSDIRKRLLEQL